MVQTSCNCFKMVFNNLILLATFLAFSSCGQGERLNTDTELERKIEEEVTSGQNILDLGRITNRDWDSLLILTPYTNSDKMEKQLGISLSRTKHSGIESRDDISQLIFFEKGEPVDMVEYPRYLGDFSNNGTGFIRKDSAVFDIILTTGKTFGENDWIELKLR